MAIKKRIEIAGGWNKKPTQKATKWSEKLKAYTALVKEPSSVPSVHVRQFIAASNFSSRSVTSSCTYKSQLHTEIHEHAQKQKQWNQKVNQEWNHNAQTAWKRRKQGRSYKTLFICSTKLPFQNTKTPQKKKKDWIAPVAGIQALLNFLRGLGCGSSVEYLPVCIWSWGPTQQTWKI